MTGGRQFVLVERRGHREQEIAEADNLEEIQDIIRAKAGTRRPSD